MHEQGKTHTKKVSKNALEARETVLLTIDHDAMLNAGFSVSTDDRGNVKIVGRVSSGIDVGLDSIYEYMKTWEIPEDEAENMVVAFADDVNARVLWQVLKDQHKRRGQR